MEQGWLGDLRSQDSAYSSTTAQTTRCRTGVHVWNCHNNSIAVKSMKRVCQQILRDINHAQREPVKHLSIILGDFNIAPEDRDVYDPEKWGEEVLCSPKERQALSKMTDLGFVDVFRLFDQDEKSFSWWDYRAASFRRNAGVRIDLILANKSLSKKCVKSVIDREPRAWERPSDHTPVVAQFDI